MAKKNKRSLETYGLNQDFDNYVDSVRTATILENNMNMARNQYRQAIINAHNAEVQQNKDDANRYGPLAIFPIMYRGAKDMFGFTRENNEVTKSREEFKKARKAYNKFTGK